MQSRRPLQILDIRQKDGKKYCLVRWQGRQVQESNWQPFADYEAMTELISKYKKSIKKSDKEKNFSVKVTQEIRLGYNPYLQTAMKGHFLYGDEPQKIVSLKVYEPQGEDQEKTVIAEVQWRNRQEVDPKTNKKNVTILENSFLDTRKIQEYRPDFLIGHYEKRVKLIPTNE